MEEQGNTSPLFDSQREKSGAETFGKYSYQYHWALYRILSDHEKQHEYVVFVELHEDVVVSDSLDSTKAKFEFNQVKTSKHKFNTTRLVKNKKSDQSVLGKLIKSWQGKQFSKQITSLNLVALNAFDLELKKDDVKLNKIRIEDCNDMLIDHSKYRTKK